MSISWLDCILSRRYALTVMGDPIPVCPAALLTDTAVEDGGATRAELCGATQCDAGEPSVGNKDFNKDFNKDAGPFLIIANTPSLIAPLLLYAHVAQLKPLVVLRQEQSPALRMFAGTAELCILPPAQEDEEEEKEKREEAEQPDNPAKAGKTEHAPSVTDEAEQAVLTRVADALAQGRSVLLWPSPRVQRTGYECVPAHNAAFSLLQLLATRGQALPELFLVRAEGLWGSRFSWYRRQTLSFGARLWAMLPAVFLGPLLKRRPVRLVLRRHKMCAQSLQQSSFQTMLNAWFGAGHKDAVLVPLWALRRIRCMPLEVLTQTEACAAVQAAMQTDRQADKSAMGTPPPLAGAIPDAGGVVSAGEMPDSPPAPNTADKPTPSVPASQAHPAPTSTEQEYQYLQAADCDDSSAVPPPLRPEQQEPKQQAVEQPIEQQNTPNTPLADINPAVPRTPPLLPVQHALTRQGSITDASYGHHFSRRTLLGLAKAIGTLLGPVPATRIGMSLPCGTGALASYIAILDCTLEDDRIPVILDPSMSLDQLAQCAQETGITHVVTSRTFKGRGLPPNTQPVYLEDISSAQVMRGSALSFMGFAGTTEVDSLAAILCSPATAPANGEHSNEFSITTHADVQPLPLSHQALMTALHNLIRHLTAPPLNVHSLSILGCLPPHSPLGLLVNMVLPLTCGVPIVTVNAEHDSAVLARSAENHSVNFFAGSPASMRKLLHEARSHLAFRYVLLSQEPCSPELLALIPKACPHASIFSADRHGNIVLL